jgi:hypothetical protein
VADDYLRLARETVRKSLSNTFSICFSRLPSSDLSFDSSLEKIGMALLSLFGLNAGDKAFDFNPCL